MFAKALMDTRRAGSGSEEHFALWANKQPLALLRNAGAGFLSQVLISTLIR